MLEQLEKVDGVESAMANHTGSLVRVSLKESSDAHSVASELEAILAKQKRKPTLLSGLVVAKALKDEHWREAEKIGELSEIEFRTVFERRVKQFTKEGDLDEDTIAKLLEFSRQVLDETPASNADTDWGDFCGGLASRMIDKAKEVLNKEQLEELAKKLKARVIG